MNEKIAVTTNEACELLSLGRTTLYKLINEGKIQPRKVGSKTLFIVDELKAFIDGAAVVSN